MSEFEHNFKKLSARYDALQLSSRVAVATVTRALDAIAPAMDEASAFAVLRERFPAAVAA